MLIAAFPDEERRRRNLCWSSGPEFFKFDRVLRGKKSKINSCTGRCNSFCQLVHIEHSFCTFGQEIEGISKINDGYNPATWMLEVSSSAQEEMLGIDFAEVYRQSELYQ